MSTLDETSTQRPVRVGPTLTGLMLGLLVAMLSSSIISTSLPRIISDLGGTQATLTWTVTAALLTITVTTPIWGKLSDMIGRRALINAALTIFLVGSVVCGLAVGPEMLIAGRAVQGVGAGGLLTLVQIVLADIISPRDRGKYMGLFGAVMAVGTIGGPLLGGFLTDALGWRWNFYSAIPVAVISLVVVSITLRVPRRNTRVHIDYAGALLISAGVSGLLVWVSQAGSWFPWLSVTSLVLGSGSVVLLILAVIVEARAKEPIIPLSLFRNRGFVLTVLASLSVGVATYGTAVFVSQYLQLSRGASTTESGLIALPQLIAVTIASTVAGALISRTGKWKPWMLIGASSLAVGVTMLGMLTVSTPMPYLWVAMALVGIGIGCVMQNLVLMAEINVDPRQVGVASAGVAFFRSLGGTIGVTLLGAILSIRAQSVVQSNSTKLQAAGIDAGTVDLTKIADLQTLGQPLRGIVEEAYARGVADAFLYSAPLAIVTIIAIALLPARELSTRTRGQRIEDLEAKVVDTSAGISGAVPTLDEEIKEGSRA